jgi:hypothetical protein
MEVVLSLLIVTASFAAFAAISYFLIKSTFSRIDGDDWEEQYVKLKKEAKPLASKRRKLQFQKSKMG